MLCPTGRFAFFSLDRLIVTRHLGTPGGLQIPYSNVGIIPEEGTATQVVQTDQSSTSTTYTDLATVGPRVTITVPRSGKLLVIWKAETYGSNNTYSAPELSGANTYSAADTDAANSRSSTLLYPSIGMKLFTGLNPGTTTVTLKYRPSTATGNF